jgi:hypothetical protein
MNQYDASKKQNDYLNNVKKPMTISKQTKLPIKTTTTTTNKKPQKSSYIKSNGELSSRVEETPFKPDFVKYIENSNQIVQQTQQQHQIESQLKARLKS